MLYRCILLIRRRRPAEIIQLLLLTLAARQALLHSNDKAPNDQETRLHTPLSFLGTQNL